MKTIWVPDQQYYNISLEYELSSEETEEEYVFECNVTIPNTTYAIEDAVLYYPGELLLQIISK